MLKINNRRKKLWECSFAVLLFLFIASIILEDNFVYGHFIPHTAYSIIRYSILAIFAVKTLLFDFRHFSKFSRILTISLLAVALGFSVFSNDRTLFQIAIISISFYGSDFKNVAKIVLISQSLLLATIAILSVLGVVPDITVGRVGSAAVRHSFGFTYTTFLPISFFSIAVTTLYLFGNKIKIWHTAIFAIVATILFLTTDTRISFAFTIIAIVLFLVQKKVNLFKNRIVSLVLSLSPIIFLLISILLPTAYFYNPNQLSGLDHVASGRLYYLSNAMAKYPPSLTGSKINYYSQSATSSGSIIIDNSYIDLLLSNGVVITCIVLLLFISLSKKAEEQGDHYLQLALFLMLSQSLFNPDLMMIKYNLFLLFLATPLIRPNSNVRRNNVDIDRVHGAQTAMLSELSEKLESMSLKYYLCGGTLLGAVRHKGFIPWDDDVDLLMPRADYERLIQETQDGKLSENLSIGSFKHKNASIPFIKVYDKRYAVGEEFISLPEGEYLWIDIFPIDGLSDDDATNAELYKKVHRLRHMLTMRLMTTENLINKSRNTLLAILKLPIKLFLNCFPRSFYCHLIDKNSQKYSYDKSKYVGGVLWGYGPQEKMPKAECDKEVKLKFSGLNLPTFSCHDMYLKNLYGDYMKFPPVEARKGHLLFFEEIKSHEK